MTSSKPLVPIQGEKPASNNFDLIRICMALLVVVSHSYALYRGSELGEPLSRLTQSTINSGNLGVYVFFMVSGYLITQSFNHSKSYWSYLKKRIARIHPGFIVATSLCGFVIVPIFSQTAHFTPWLVMKALVLNLLLQGFFVDNSTFSHNLVTAVNGSLWSIPYEFWCYLGVLALGIVGLMKSKRRVVIAVLCFAVMATGFWLEVTGRKPGGGVIGTIIGWPYLWFKVLPCFLAGMLVHQYREILPRRLWLLITAAALVLIAANLPLPQPWKTAVVGFLFPPCAAYAVFYLAFMRQIADGARFGDFSYGTYLYAFPVQQILLACFGQRIPFLLFILISMVLSLGAGIVSWFTVERWFLSRQRRTRHSEVNTAKIKAQTEEHGDKHPCVQA